MICFPITDDTLKTCNFITLCIFLSVSSFVYISLEKLDYNSSLTEPPLGFNSSLIETAMSLALNLVDSFNCKIKPVKIKQKVKEVKRGPKLEMLYQRS